VSTFVGHEIAFRPTLSAVGYTDRSRAEKLWLVCGVMGDVMLCDRERDVHRSQKFYATIHSEKMTYLTIVLFCKRQFPAAVCFRDKQ
jgi:hypothetical protein